MIRRIRCSTIDATLFVVVIILLFQVFSGSGCQQFTGKVPQNLNEIAEGVKEIHVPDSRMDVFRIELQKKGKRVFVHGEVTEAAFRDALLDSLRNAAPRYTYVDSIRVLPSEELGSETYGIVRVSVAPMRRKPARSSEMVSQTLLGTVVKLYKQEGGFYYVHNWDRYLGWVAKNSLARVDSDGAKEWQKDPRVVCVANYGVIRVRPDSRADILVDLVPGTVLKKLGSSRQWIKIGMPDGRVGWIEKDLVVDEEALRRTRANPDRIVSTAKRFLGIPYLWGGTSSKGLDCSGFVQTVYSLNNIPLPRDANQIARIGETVDPDEKFGNLHKGDLLFFGSSPDRITHCGIYVGDRKYIHSTTSSSKVNVNSFDPQDPLYYEYLHKNLRAVKRMSYD